MDLRTLKYFCTIVEQGSITNASKKLNIVQPALSVELRKLEEELGVVLFDRNNKTIAITKEGRLLYSKALNLLSYADNIVSDMKDYKRKTILRVGIMSSSYGIYLTSGLHEFINDNPNISFDIYEGTTYELLELITDNQIDFAFVRTPFNNKNVVRIDLKSEPMVAIGKEEFFSSNSDEIDIAELAHLPLVYYKRYDELLTNIFTKNNIEVNILCKNEDARTTILWANDGLGVGIIPYSAIKMVDPLLKIKILKDKELYTTPMIVYNKNHALSKEVQDLINKYINDYTTK